MARHVRAGRLESRAARLKLKVRKKPHSFTLLAPGIFVGYRRNEGPGTWVLKAANGKGGYWTRRIGLADDFEDADGNAVLSYWQAQDKARKLARGSTIDEIRPIAVTDAVVVYERDLNARGGSIKNAKMVRSALTAALAAKLVALLTARELKHWRDSLLDGREPATVNRICKAAKAAFNLAAAHDPRITNSDAWRVGLAGLPDANKARRVGLPDATVQAIVEASCTIGEQFGLWWETMAITGARPSQLARLNVADLDVKRARLLMPTSKKGRGQKRIDRYPVPIPQALTAKLKQAAASRSADAPLLVNASGRRFAADSHMNDFAVAAKAAGVGVTAYALRHSSIVRQLLGGVPTRLVSKLHDTSEAMITAHYGAYILDDERAIELARRTLPDFSAADAAPVLETAA
jgi:integrase